MDIRLRQQLSVMLDLAMHVADQSRCSCEHEPVGHVAGCDHQVTRSVLHSSARMLGMPKAEREALVARLREQLGVS